MRIQAANTFYTGTYSVLNTKSSFPGTLEQRFGTLMMKTYVQSYTQDY